MLQIVNFTRIISPLITQEEGEFIFEFYGDHALYVPTYVTPATLKLDFYMLLTSVLYSGILKQKNLGGSIVKFRC